MLNFTPSLYFLSHLVRWKARLNKSLTTMVLLGGLATTAANGQESVSVVQDCGTTDHYTEAEAEALPWFGNNQFLVDELQRRSIPISLPASNYRQLFCAVRPLIYRC